MNLVIGPHRSGTSIVTRILQRHVGEFPFEVSRHAEPFELVDLHTQFLERKGMAFLDRLHFPQLSPDLKLFQDLTALFEKYRETPCFVKEPMLTITMKWFPLHHHVPTVFVSRSEIEMARSLEHHKKMTFSAALSSARWYYDAFHELTRAMPELPRIYFCEDDERMIPQLQAAVEFFGLTWNEEFFRECWNRDAIRPYVR